MGRHLTFCTIAKKIIDTAPWIRPRMNNIYATYKCPSINHSVPKKQTFCRRYCTEANTVNPLLQHIKARIKANGPMPVADYMKEVLTNSAAGYYMHKDVFGAEGDFITSPEISQMFGEMLGVWIVNEWMNNYNDQEIQIVELGPGRGTLADDLLRTFCHFPSIKDKVSLHLAEVSPTLGKMQAAKLTGREMSEFEDEDTDSPGAYRSVKSKYDIDVSWFRSLADVPQGSPSCFIAHEFLDALPIYKFQKTDSGWREILVDEDPSKPGELRLVLAPGRTPASVGILSQLELNDDRDHIEICPTAGLLVHEMCRRIKADGGMALLADYGHTGEKDDTFRAFKKHKLHDPLVDPGSADITADVDFSYLKSFTDSEVSVFGPITQEKFLTNMGIGVRLQVLLQNSSQENWANHISAIKMLLQPEQMGERFKFLALLSKREESYKPGGFVDLFVENKDS